MSDENTWAMEGKVDIAALSQIPAGPSEAMIEAGVAEFERLQRLPETDRRVIVRQVWKAMVGAGR